VLQQRGLAFMCTAALGDRRYPFAVTESDGNGHVRYVGPVNSNDSTGRVT
jgi:hypothetical protein